MLVAETAGGYAVSVCRHNVLLWLWTKESLHMESMSFVEAMVKVDPKKNSNKTTSETRKKQLEEEVMIYQRIYFPQPLLLVFILLFYLSIFIYTLKLWIEGKKSILKEFWSFHWIPPYLLLLFFLVNLGENCN